MIDYNALFALSTGAGLDTPSTSAFWTDPHISQFLLQTHLDPSTDLASRRPAVIASTVDWLRATVLAPKTSVLDLGCGPGLYAEALAAAGYAVRGLDFSERSIEYARRSAERNGYSIEYEAADYLKADFGAGYDAVLMIYCDLGALGPKDRELIFEKAKHCLKPGGAFVFDLFAPTLLDSMKEGRTWSFHESGFWSPKPHLVLEELTRFPELNAVLRMNLVAEAEGGRIERYMIKDYCFDEEAIVALARKMGFASCDVHRGLLPPSTFPGNDPLFAVARKERIDAL